MFKRFPFLWMIFTLPLGIALFPKKDQPVVTANISAPSNYRLRAAISCSPFSYVPEDFLKRPIGLKKGIGSIDFPISAASHDAQIFFNQGMTYLFNFEYVQAARSLYVATGYDSTNAMLYWGLSQAYENLNDSTESRNMAAKALSLSAGSSTREQQFIKLQHALVQPAHDSIAVKHQREKISGMMDTANLVLKDDPEMWIYTGVMRAYGDFKGPEGETYAQKCRQAIDYYFTRALKLSPNHFGAWHYLIHFNEGASDFKKALDYGKMYTKAAPAIPHAWHMYAHDLMKTGKVSEAIEKFNYAFGLEEKKYATEQMPAHYDWHHQHNLELLAYCYQYKGQFKKAEAIFSKLDTLTAFISKMEGRIRKGHPYFYLQNNQPAQASQLAEPLIRSKEASNRFTGFFIRGLAQVFQKDIAGARASYASVMHIIDSLKERDIKKGTRAADAEEQYRFSYAMAGIVDMGVGLLQHPYDTTIMKQMNKIQATLLKQTGPDPWIDALYFLQLLTQMSIKTGNMELAESSAINMTKHDPEYPGSYWLLARIKKMRGDEKSANEYLSKARIGYQQADADFIIKLAL